MFQKGILNKMWPITDTKYPYGVKQREVSAHKMMCIYDDVLPNTVGT